MNLVVENSKPALPHGGDGGSEQAFAAALERDLSNAHGDSNASGGVVVFSPFPITSFIEGGVLTWQK